MNHAINCEISEKLSANCTCGVDMAVPLAQVPPSAVDSGSVDELFPVLLSPAYDKQKVYVPWGIVAKHRGSAERNHGQSLNELASRGGLSPCELAAVLEDRAWRRMGDEAAWRSIWRSILRTTEHKSP